MNQRKNNSEALDRLAAAIVDDILNASNEEVAADLIEVGLNPTHEAEAMRALIERTSQQRGKWRLRAAKEALAASATSAAQDAVRLNVSEARKRLATILEQNVGKLSMAARNESELSDSDVLGMLADFEELELTSGPKPLKPSS